MEIRGYSAAQNLFPHKLEKWLCRIICSQSDVSVTSESASGYTTAAQYKFLINAANSQILTNFPKKSPIQFALDLQLSDS